MKGAQGSMKWTVRGRWGKHAVACRQAPPGSQTCPGRGAPFLRGSSCCEGAAGAPRASGRMNQGGADVMGAAVCGVRCVEASTPCPRCFAGYLQVPVKTSMAANCTKS